MFRAVRCGWPGGARHTGNDLYPGHTLGALRFRSTPTGLQGRKLGWYLRHLGSRRRRCPACKPSYPSSVYDTRLPASVVDDVFGSMDFYCVHRHESLVKVGLSASITWKMVWFNNTVYPSEFYGPTGPEASQSQAFTSTQSGKLHPCMTRIDRSRLVCCGSCSRRLSISTSLGSWQPTMAALCSAKTSTRRTYRWDDTGMVTGRCFRSSTGSTTLCALLLALPLG